ncbi:hypothetical protein NDU88_002007 [Pleurodeles waltl]|uniref:Uncharacterized protein n=1 Tax=Pleurodeles waltl TaxID=8319 RepID=A0AAV7VA03_PLEWA|nr:hypothetical protein NDU88_002007 [Pleurodeles waltl]
MLVGSVLPLRQRSIGGREGAGGVPASCRLREPQMCRCQGAAVRCAPLVVRPLVAGPVTPGRRGKGGEALGSASSASLLFRAVMLVGSVLPLRQRSIGREGGGRRRPGQLPAPGAADVPLSRRR